MDLKIIKADLKVIQALRILFLKENDFQFIYNKYNIYGQADTFLHLIDHSPVG